MDLKNEFDIKLIQNNLKFNLKLLFINLHFLIELNIYNYGNSNFYETNFTVKVTYINYILYDKYIQLEFSKSIFGIYEDLKNLFITLNKDIITTPFIGTKKEVDDLENLINILNTDKKYTTFVSKDAVIRVKELTSNTNYTQEIPQDFDFLKNIKFMKYFFGLKEEVIFFYVKFEYGSELIKIHEQYAYNIYKIYKKIANI